MNPAPRCYDRYPCCTQTADCFGLLKATKKNVMNLVQSQTNKQSDTSVTFVQAIQLIQVKGMVLYSAVSSPLDRSKRFTLSSPGRTVHSDTNSASLGSILAMQQLRNGYSITFPPLSIARYSFIQLSRLRRREVKENAQTSKR